MISTLTALAATVFLGVSSPGVKAGAEVPAVHACCHCACCKGGVCRCGMHRQAAAQPKASKHVVTRQVANAGCHCRDSGPVSHSQSNDILGAGNGPFYAFHPVMASGILALPFAHYPGVRRAAAGLFDPSPPGSFRSIPLRI
jgi:hypothetical protein